jgi:molecular chaperone DnaK
VPEKELKEVRSRIDNLKKLLEPEKKDLAKIKAAVDELNDYAQKAGAELYKKAAEAQAAKEGKGKSRGASADEETASDEDVVDAEVVKEEKETKAKKRK